LKRSTTAIILAIVVLIAAGCGTSGDGAGNSPGNKAPDFTLRTIDGDKISLSDFNGRPVMLNFWATWCGPCREEMPYLQSIQEDASWIEDGLVILAVDAAETPTTVNQFLDTFGITFNVVIDADNEVFLDYSIRAIPTTYFIDSNGIIKAVKIGAFVSKEQIEEGLKMIVD
jgi:peroxiredoxin